MKIFLSVDSNTGEVEKIGEYPTIDKEDLTEIGYLKLEQLIKIVATVCNIRYDRLQQKTKQEPIIQIRQILWYIMFYKFKYDNLSLLGRLFRFGHATVYHGINVVEKEVFGTYVNAKYKSYWDTINNYFTENNIYNKILIL